MIACDMLTQLDLMVCACVVCVYGVCLLDGPGDRDHSRR